MTAFTTKSCVMAAGLKVMSSASRVEARLLAVLAFRTGSSVFHTTALVSS